MGKNKENEDARIVTSSRFLVSSVMDEPSPIRDPLHYGQARPN